MRFISSATLLLLTAAARAFTPFTPNEANIWALCSNPPEKRKIEQSESRAKRTKLLSMVDVLEPLTSEEIERLAQRTPERAFGKGETVYAPGAASEVILVVLTESIR